LAGEKKSLVAGHWSFEKSVWLLMTSDK